MGTIKTTNIEPIADNGTVTLGSSGDTFTVPAGVTITNSGTATGFGGTTAPYVSVYRNGDQNLFLLLCYILKIVKNSCLFSKLEC